MATATTTPTFLHGKNTRVVFVNPSFTSATLLANTTNLSTQITAVSSSASIVIGQPITGSGIPAATTIVGISGQTITLSAAATATASGASLTVSSTGIGYDFSPFFNDVSTNASIEASETTTFLRNGTKTYIPGIKDGAISLNGFYDGTVSGVDAIFQTAITNSGDDGAIIWPGGGLTENERCYMAQVIETKYDLKSPVAGVVAADMDLQADGGVWRGHGSYYPSLSASGSSTAYARPGGHSAGTASTAKGGLLILGFMPTSGTGTWSLTFQHSQDGSTWVSGTPPNTGGVLATDASAGAQIVVLSGTIYQYTQLVWTLTGTGTANIFYGFARY
jgi:hypothetical protein